MSIITCSLRRFGFIRLLVLSCVLAAPGAAVSSSTGLPAPVEKKLRNYRIPPQDVSLYVREVSSPSALVAVNQAVPRNPASVMKLLTALVALDVLGADYTWRTEAYVSGSLREGRLRGDLILKGYGDPYMTPEAFWKFVRGIRQRGLREISGNVAVDDSFFAPPVHQRGEFDGEPRRVYNALPHALSLNFQSTQLYLSPDRESDRVRVFTEPPLANLHINNGLKLVNAPCWGRYHRPRLAIADGGGDTTVRLHGSYSAKCPEAVVTRLMMKPSEHVGGAFTALWQELGGRFKGEVATGSVPEDAVLFHAAESRPLGEVIRGMNKHSNNLMSRLVFLTVGAELEGAPGTVEKGRKAVAEWLHAQALDFPTLFVDNGSGLSRDARISANSIGRLLLHAYDSPQMPEFMGSLAVAGVDGTMRRRFRGASLAKRAHVKTGSLDDVSALAGYVLGRNGRRWVVVLMINHPGLTAWQGKQVQDIFLRWVLDHAGEEEQLRMAKAHGRAPGPSDGTLSADATRPQPPDSARTRSQRSGSGS